MTTEAVIENATIDWLTDLGYIHIKGNELPENANAVILKGQLLAFIQEQYPHLPEEIQHLAVADFCNNQGADIDYRNRSFISN